MISLTLLVALVGVQAPLPSEPGTPDAAVEAFFAAFDAQQWREAVALLELTDLDAYRRGMTRRPRRPERVPTIEDFMQRDPNMPRVVAEYELQQYLENRPSLEDFLESQFAGVRSLEQLDSLPIDEVAVRWLQAQHPIRELEQQLKARGCPIPPDLDSTRGLIKPQILGPVFTDVDQAFVLFRLEHSEFPTGFHTFGPLVAALKLTDRGWRVLARNGLVTVPNTFRSLLQCP